MALIWLLRMIKPLCIVIAWSAKTTCYCNKFEWHTICIMSCTFVISSYVHTQNTYTLIHKSMKIHEYRAHVFVSLEFKSFVLSWGCLCNKSCTYYYYYYIVWQKIMNCNLMEKLFFLLSFHDEVNVNKGVYVTQFYNRKSLQNIITLNKV